MQHPKTNCGEIQSPLHQSEWMWATSGKQTFLTKQLLRLWIPTSAVTRNCINIDLGRNMYFQHIPFFFLMCYLLPSLMFHRQILALLAAPSNFSHLFLSPLKSHSFPYAGPSQQFQLLNQLNPHLLFPFILLSLVSCWLNDTAQLKLSNHIATEWCYI